MNLKALKRADGMYAMGGWGSQWTALRTLAYKFHFADEAAEHAAEHLSGHNVTVVDVDDGDRLVISADRIDQIRERMARYRLEHGEW